jgi:hypothetical protein
MKVGTLWKEYSASSPYMNQRFGGTYHLRLQGRKLVEQKRSVLTGG